MAMLTFKETYKYKELDEELEEELRAEMLALALEGRTDLPEHDKVNTVLES